MYVHELETLQMYIVCLYDNLGRLIGGNVAGSKTIATANYKKGIYFLVIKDAKGNIVKTEKLLNE